MASRNSMVLPEDITVRDLAKMLEVGAVEIQKRLVGDGVFAKLDQTVDRATAQRLVSTLHRSLKFAGDLSLDNVQGILCQLEPIWQARDLPVSVDIDLGNLGFIYPSAMALLTTTILRLRQNDVPVSINRPVNIDVDDYLNRMDFYRLAGVDARYRWRRHDSAGRFVEIKQVHSEEDGDSVIAGIVDILERRMRGIEQLRQAIQYAFHELVNNVFHHAQSPTDAIVCAQSYDTKRQVELGVVDSGRGIPASLGENSALKDRFVTASEAIELAVQPRVTGRPDENTGEGLFFTLEFIKDNGGCACVHSQDGMLRIERGQTTVQAASLWLGTWVGLRFNTDRPVDTQRVFSRYAPPENDYEWLFDDSAVSY